MALNRMAGSLVLFKFESVINSQYPATSFSTTGSKTSFALLLPLLPLADPPLLLALPRPGECSLDQLDRRLPLYRCPEF